MSFSNALPIRTGVNKLLRPSAASFEAISGQLTPLLKPSTHKHQPRPVYIAGTMKRSLSSSVHAQR